MILNTFWVRRFFPDRTSINFLKPKLFFIVASIVLTLATFVGLYTRSLNFGIDFTGGLLFEVRLSKKADVADVRHTLNKLNFGEVNIQNLGDNVRDIMIRVGVKDDSKQKEYIDSIKGALVEKIDKKVEFRKVEYVGGEVGSETVKKAILAMTLTLAGILVYIWFRFNVWYSFGVIIGLVHDIILTLGFLSLTQYEFSTASIAALLTILGYSVNDSVVIYDRVRENVKKMRKISFNEVLNISINETLSRTIFTVVTTLLAAGALIVFGGESLYSFSVTVFIGIVIGTYSSIFIAVPLLSYFVRNEQPK